MNNFQEWLRGYLEDKESLTKEQIGVIKAEMSKYTSPEPFTISETVECQHDYPNVWHGVIPPTCNLCGKQAGFGYATNVTYKTDAT